MCHLEVKSSLRCLLEIALAATFVIACSDEEEEGRGGPTPRDALVYAASAETARDVGIVTWGFDERQTSDGRGVVAVFRGYDRGNALVIEIRETVAQVDFYTKTFALEMSGALASGSSRIAVIAEWETPEREGLTYRRDEVENTFEQDSIGARVLSHLGPDAIAGQKGTALPGPESGVSLIGTRNTPPPLLDPDAGQLLQCTCVQVLGESAAMAAQTGAQCLLSGAGQSTTTKNLSPLALEIAPDGKRIIRSPYELDKQNIVDNHCHHAAAANVSDTEGYIGCVPSASSTSYSGHTISWAPDPAKPGKSGAYCAYEPGRNGAREGDEKTSICCWEGARGFAGEPALDSKEAQSCVTTLCQGQANFANAAEVPTAHPAGSKPPLPIDCPATKATQKECNTCCSDQAKLVRGLTFVKDDPKRYLPEIKDYQERCAQGCLDRAQSRPTNAQRDPCVESLLQRLLKGVIPALAACEASNRK